MKSIGDMTDTEILHELAGSGLRAKVLGVIVAGMLEADRKPPVLSRRMELQMADEVIELVRSYEQQGSNS